MASNRESGQHNRLGGESGMRKSGGGGDDGGSMQQSGGGGARKRVFLREREGAYALSPRGWQLTVAPPPMEDVRLRLRRS